MAGQGNRRRGRRLAVGALVSVVLLAGLLVAADRLSASFAARRIADEVSQEVASREITAGEPDVRISGFPFLTQVLSGRYELISIELRNVDGGGVRLPQLDVEAAGVHAPLRTLRSGQGEIRADQVRGTATVGYATVAALANQPGLQLSGEDGQLRVRLPVEILGQHVVLVGTAKVQVDGQRIRVIVSKLDDENGALPAQARSVADRYAKRLSVTLVLPALPFNLTVGEVTPQSQGLAITATARSVPILG